MRWNRRQFNPAVRQGPNYITRESSVQTQSILLISFQVDRIQQNEYVCSLWTHTVDTTFGQWLNVRWRDSSMYKLDKFYFSGITDVIYITGNQRSKQDYYFNAKQCPNLFVQYLSKDMRIRYSHHANTQLATCIILHFFFRKWPHCCHFVVQE